MESLKIMYAIGIIWCCGFLFWISYTKSGKKWMKGS
jgi:hypothetical protein